MIIGPGGPIIPRICGNRVRCWWTYILLKLRSDPGAAPYRIIAGLYTQGADGELLHLGEPAEIGRLR